jgi:hypothetical protein
LIPRSRTRSSPAAAAARPPTSDVANTRSVRPRSRRLCQAVGTSGCFELTARTDTAERRRADSRVQSPRREGNRRLLRHSPPPPTRLPGRAAAGPHAERIHLHKPVGTSPAAHSDPFGRRLGISRHGKLQDRRTLREAARIPAIRSSRRRPDEPCRSLRRGPERRARIGGTNGQERDAADLVSTRRAPVVRPTE